MKRLLLSIVWLVLWLNSLATVYYISSSTGNDNNNGLSPSTPWNSLTKVSDFNFISDDVILFKTDDTWFGTLTIHSTGTPSHPIIYSSYGSGNPPKISGFVPVSTWSSLGNSIWESSTAVSTLATLNMVTIGGINTPMGRTPNFPNYYTWQSHGGSGSSLTLTSSNLNSSVIDWSNPHAEVAWFGTTYIVNRAPIVAASGTQITFTPYNPATIIWQNSPGYFLQYFIIQNDPRTLDIQNEWYYDPGTKKIRIFSSSQPQNVKIAAVTTLLLLQSFKDWIVISNIDFEGSNGDAIVAGGVKHTTITACRFNFIGGNAITGGSFTGDFPGNIISNCNINNVQNMGIDVWKRYAILSDTVKNVGEIMGMNSPMTGSVSVNSIATGIRVRDDSSIVSNCVLDSCGYLGIYWFGQRSIVNNNFLNHMCSLNQLRDGGAIYTWNGTSPIVYTGSKVYGNIALNTGSSTAGIFSQGIYFDANGNTTEVFGNSTLGGEWGFYAGLSTYGINFHNNTAYDPKISCITIDARGNNPSNNFTLRSNIFFAKQASQFSLWTLNAPSPTMQLPFTSDSNYFARPIADNLTIQSLLGVNNTQRNLAQWQAFNSCDANSHISPRTITNVNQLDFEYNATLSPVVKTLPVGTWVDVFNTSYSGTITLQPYTSAVLINIGGNTPPTANAGADQVLTFPTVSTTLSGSGSDPDGTVVAYNWTKLSGGAVTITNPNSASTTLTGMAVGVYQFQLTVTDNSGSTGTDNVQVTVNPGNATVSYTVTSKVFNNTPQGPTILTNPAGLATATTFDGVGGLKTHVGTWNNTTTNIIDPNWTSTPITAPFSITPAPATITASNNIQQYDSTLKNITVASNPAGLSTLITGAPQRYTGMYALNVNVTNTDYNAPTLNTSLTITAGVGTVIWNPVDLTYPNPIGAGQTNAGSPKSASYNYVPPSGTILNAGTHALQVNVVFADTNIAPLNGVVRNITVNKGTTATAVSDTIQFADGSPKTITAIPGQSGTVTVVYTGAHTAVGDYPFTATYSSPNWNAPVVNGTLHIISNAANIYITNFANRVYTGFQIPVTVTSLYSYSLTYNGSVTPPTNVNAAIIVIATITDGIHTGADTVTMNIIKADPPYTWPAIAPIQTPTPLSATQLNITSPIPISVAYNPVIGTVLAPGTQNISATITPTDVANYNIITVTNQIVVSSGVAAINVFNTNQTYNGTPRPIGATTTPANLDSLDILYGVTHVAPTNAGSYPFSVNLINSTYVAPQVLGTLIISKASSVLSWAIPSQIQQGTPLSILQLNPGSNIAGSFTFNYPIGYIFSIPGTYILIATFHPTDLTNYVDGQTVSVPISINGSPFLQSTIIHSDQIYENLPYP